MADQGVVSANRIETLILMLRGLRVMLDTDLAALYGVRPKALNQTVKRNRDRFPNDFMFQLMQNETAFLRSQNVTSSHAERRFDVIGANA
jgi:hypothetical protein